MHQKTVKNAVLLTGSDIFLRLAGMGFRVYLASALGGEGMGLYQLVLAVYSLFITLATAGVSVASTRLLAEEMERETGQVRAMLVRLVGVALLLGGTAMAGQMALAKAAAIWWLGDARAIPSLRLSSLSLPFMAVSAVLRGFFLAERDVTPNMVSQLIEQIFRIGIVFFRLEYGGAEDITSRCAAVLWGSATSEAVSTALMVWFYRKKTGKKEKQKPQSREKENFGRIWEIVLPVEASRVLSGAMRTAENMLVPACLTLSLTGQGGRKEAVAQYGCLKGMTLPLLLFPFGILGSLSSLIMPEITRAHINADPARLRLLLERLLTLTVVGAVFMGSFFTVWGGEVAGFLFADERAGEYLRVLAPVMPLLYLESMVDGAMKGIGEQKASFRYSLWDSVGRIFGVIVLLPRFGMWGLLFVIILSNGYTCFANLGRLLHVVGMKIYWERWFFRPLCGAMGGWWIGCRMQNLLPMGTGWMISSVRLALGGLAMGVTYLGILRILGEKSLGEIFLKN